MTIISLILALISFPRLNARRNLRSELGKFTTFGEIITGCTTMNGPGSVLDRGIEVNIETKVCLSQY